MAVGWLNGRYPRKTINFFNEHNFSEPLLGLVLDPETFLVFGFLRQEASEAFRVLVGWV